MRFRFLLSEKVEMSNFLWLQVQILFINSSHVLRRLETRMYNSVASRRSFQLVEPIVVFVHANNFLVERLPATGIETASPPGS